LPRRKRQRRIPTPAWGSPRGALGQTLLGRSLRFYATVGIVALVVVAVGIVGFAYGTDYWADHQRPGSTAVQIDDIKYDLRYFSARLKMYVQQSGLSNEDAQPEVAIPAVADLLADEVVIRRFATEMGVSATDSEIKDEIAARLGLTSDDASYDTLFQQELSQSGLKEEEYRQMVQANVLNNKILQKLEAELPASAESVHLRQIVVSDAAAADEIKQQVEQGADFAQLAAERSLDTTTKDNGGDAGWVPRGLLQKEVEDILFALEPGGVETFSITSGAVVLQVLEKAQDRPIEEDQKLSLAAGRLGLWLNEKRKQVEVRDLVSQDEEKASWVIKRAYAT